MEESKLIFSLDRYDDGPTVAFSRDQPGPRRSRPDPSLGLELEPCLEQGRRPKAFHLPLSPSSPGSLADLAASSSRLVPAAGLVRWSSTELLEPRETDPLRAKPLLSLVKSLSTETSRRGQPNAFLSRSDPKLHMHPWRQLTQPRPQEASPWTGAAARDVPGAGPPSPGGLSPSEPRGSSLIAELEDTRRKFSEAMQEPLSMLSKMMGDEGSGSPRQGRGDLPAPQAGSGWSDGGPKSAEDGGADGQGLKCCRRRRTNGEQRGAGNAPQRGSREPPLRSLDALRHGRGGDGCSEGLQVTRVSVGPRGRGAVPGGWLFLLGLLVYGFLVLPLPSYVTGLSLGLACGFMLGLLVVLVLAPRRSAGAPGSKAGSRTPDRQRSRNPDPLPEAHRDREVLEGWMNQMQAYDPETFHPSLTHSVYATLEGSRLRLAYPRASVPRWATCQDTAPEAAFLCSRCYQLENCKVSLLPPVLARKRVWNKKYPICIELAEGETGEESLMERLEEEEKMERQLFPNSLPDQPVTLYLFGRTGREKEEWFQHFLSASVPEFKGCPSRKGSRTEAIGGGDSLCGSMEDLAPPLYPRDLVGGLKEKVLLDYGSYMNRLVGWEGSSPAPSPAHSDQGSPTTCKRMPSEEASMGGPEGQAAWVNALLGRIFWDILREKYWADLVAHKIQKKLSKIRLPYFMNELTLADLDMGTCIPHVLSTSKPSLDHRGLWLEMELVYTGCLQMTLETKMNLCKLGKEGKEGGAEAHRSVPETRPIGSKPRLCVLADSDEESSSAGSSDEEEVPAAEPQGILGDKGAPPGADGHGGSTSRKILRFMDKIAKSKYFQKATENEYIRKKIAEVSNMPLMLTVEVLELSGTLAVNIPPPPTDRIWYSFRVPPRLDLRVCPMLGEREVTFTHVTEWIEKKLQREFERVLVMPNMDDLYLPVMTSGLALSPLPQLSPDRSSRRSSDLSREVVSE